MNPSILLTDSPDPAIASAAERLGGLRVAVHDAIGLANAVRDLPDVRAVIVTTSAPELQRAVIARARERSIAIVVGAADDVSQARAVELGADEWYRVPATADDIAWRVRSALARVTRHSGDRDSELDVRTGLPTLPTMIERNRALIEERGELQVFYLHFVRYTKLEELYGWEKLDAVLETTAAAVRAFLDLNAYSSTRMMVGYTNDDDFIFFRVPAAGEVATTEAEVAVIAKRLEEFVATRLEEAHGEEIAALLDIFVGHAHVYYTPKVRLERLIYRGIREAANAALGVEERARARRVADLRELLHDRAVYIEYHPIIHAVTGQTFGYEALARGQPRALRNPELMFEVAAQSDLIWELSRLCRARAVEGARELLRDQQLLFLNVDPQDFSDPGFGDLDGVDPRRVVIEITERTAIKDYPKVRRRLQALRERGFRVAVDDAGSGYAGLGSIANLEPDFIKLDMSLITSIDSNVLKQNLVSTMVAFATEQHAMVIAEGIERAEELETVKRLGVPLVQGFFLHRPKRGGLGTTIEPRAVG